MADVTLQHLLLADFLAFVLLRAVIVILMDHGTAAAEKRPPAGASGTGRGISRCARHRASFWQNALSTRGDIAHADNGATDLYYGDDRGPAGLQG